MSTLPDRLREHARLHSLCTPNEQHRVWSDDLCAAADALEAAGWRPIDTAPKDDGQHVLLHGYGDGFDDCTIVGWWCKDRERWMPFDGYARVLPSHWMPLPEPPTT
jgi:hypothetical protein